MDTGAEMRPHEKKLLGSIDYTGIPKIEPTMGDIQEAGAILKASAISRLFHGGYIEWRTCQETAREGFVISKKGRAAITQETRNE